VTQLGKLSWDLLYVFVKYQQGSRGKVFEGLGLFEGYFAK
jgi:hypothetical protein